MTIAARLHTTFAARDQRTSPRRQLRLGSTVRGEEVTIHDVSATGALIETGADLTILDNLEIELPQAGVTPAIIAWSSGRFYGCEFRGPISQAAISAAMLRSPPLREVGNLSGPIAVVLSENDVIAGIGSPESLDEDKAPLSVRLRVILGSALALWALVIWAVVSIVRSIG
jgi:hypothetical protein